MQTNQYTIGAFATLNKVSTRMLRHYDKIGLLKPYDLLENGYRVYSSEQISIVCLIKKYRACGFSLSEIASLLVADEIIIEHMVREKIAELREQDMAKSDIFRKLNHYLSHTNFKIENRYEISVSNRAEQFYISSGDFSNEEEVEEQFDNLYKTIEKNKVTLSGISMLLSNWSDNKKYRVAVPAKNIAELKGVESNILESGTYISTFHFGDYYSIGLAYDAIVKYLDTNQLMHTSHFIERYFLDTIYTQNPLEYITEISVKITP